MKPFKKKKSEFKSVKIDWLTMDESMWIPKSTAAELAAKLQAQKENELFWGHSGAPNPWYHHPATSASAYHHTGLTNYIQVFPANPEQAFMTREKAIALNNGA